jgi:hypothetical protein
MRFAEPFWQWWQRMMGDASPPPRRGTPEPTAFELGQDFAHNVGRLERLRREHRRSRRHRLKR